MKALAKAICTVESGCRFGARGGSGEGGAYQFMPATWNAYSRLVYGETLPMTAHREEFVVHVMIGLWMQQGYSESQIALKWNQGNAGACKSGVNRHGMSYDSCAYAKKVLAQL